MRRLSPRIGALGWTLVAVLVTHGLSSADSSSEIERGLALCSAGKHAEAVRVFGDLAKTDPAFARRANYEIGECYIKRGMLEDGLAAYERSLAAPASSGDGGVTDTVISLRLASGYIDAKLWDKALSAIQQISVGSPSESRRLLVKWYLRQGDTAGALAAVNRFLAQYPDDQYASSYMFSRVECVLCERAPNQMAAAVEQFRAFIAAHPGLDSTKEVRVLWPSLLQAVGKQMEGIAFLREFVRTGRAPDQVAAALEQMGNMYMEAGLYAECMTAADEVVSSSRTSDEQRARAYYTAAVACQAMSDTARAEDYLRKAIERYPDTVAAGDAKELLSKQESASVPTTGGAQ